MFFAITLCMICETISSFQCELYTFPMEMELRYIVKVLTILVVMTMMIMTSG